MRLNDAVIEEVRLLAQFPLDSSQEGLKVHSSAPEMVIQACRRLYEKGLISQVDGGYLTELGHQAADHLQVLVSILTTPSFLSQNG